MKQKYYAPKTLRELQKNLSELTAKSKIISGGTDLTIRLNEGLEEPDALLYMGSLEQVRDIKSTAEGIEIGAMASMTEISRSELLTEAGCFDALSQAAASVGCKQIRNSGTIGGNVANASAAGDLIPVLFLLDAEAVVAGSDGELRRLPVERVVTGGGQTSLAFNEAIVKFILRKPENSQRKSAFVKLGSRKALTISRIGLTAAIERDSEGAVTWAKIVVGAISTLPVRVTEGEEYLIGKKIDGDACKAVGKALSEVVLKNRYYKRMAAYGVAEDLLRLFI